MPPEPLYEPRGADYLPTEHTRGPWNPLHQHGGAVAALCARAVERAAGDEFCLTRLTLELMRPVPLERLALDLVVPRPGRRVLGMTVAVRRADLPTGEGHDSYLEPGPEASQGEPFEFGADEEPAFHRTGMELRF